MGEVFFTSVTEVLPPLTRTPVGFSCMSIHSDPILFLAGKALQQIETAIPIAASFPAADVLSLGWFFAVSTKVPDDSAVQ